MDKQKIITQINEMLQSSSAAQCTLVLEFLQHMLIRS